jgi:hypothetical protein
MATLRELRAAFPDHGAEALATVLAAHGGRGDLAAESLLAEALVGAEEEDDDDDADRGSLAGAGAGTGREGRTRGQLGADENYARLLQVRVMPLYITCSGLRV